MVPKAKKERGEKRRDKRSHWCENKKFKIFQKSEGRRQKKPSPVTKTRKATPPKKKKPRLTSSSSSDESPSVLALR